MTENEEMLTLQPQPQREIKLPTEFHGTGVRVVPVEIPLYNPDGSLIGFKHEYGIEFTSGKLTLDPTRMKEILDAAGVNTSGKNPDRIVVYAVTGESDTPETITRYDANLANTTGWGARAVNVATGELTAIPNAVPIFRVGKEFKISQSLFGDDDDVPLGFAQQGKVSEVSIRARRPLSKVVIRTGVKVTGIPLENLKQSAGGASQVARQFDGALGGQR